MKIEKSQRTKFDLRGHYEFQNFISEKSFVIEDIK